MVIGLFWLSLALLFYIHMGFKAYDPLSNQQPTIVSENVKCATTVLGFVEGRVCHYKDTDTIPIMKIEQTGTERDLNKPRQECTRPVSERLTIWLTSIWIINKRSLAQFSPLYCGTLKRVLYNAWSHNHTSNFELFYLLFWYKTKMISFREATEV